MTTQLEARVATLERMAEEQRANLEGKISADTTMLTAIGETQSTHSLQLNVIEGKIDRLGQGQETLQADMGMVKGRLEKVEGKIDKLGQDLGAVQADMATVKGRLDKVDGRLDKMDGRLDKMDGRLDKMDGRLDQIGEKLDILLNR
jgi:chromosome segregation ATPase